MSYIKPQDVTAPKGHVKDLQILFDGGEGDWALAKMTWNDEPDVLAIRWNGEGDKPSGIPISSAQPVWFILPPSIQELLKKALNFASGIKDDAE